MAESKSGQLILYSSNIVNLCVDFWGRESQRGRLYHQYTADEIPFLSLYEALDRMEQLYNTLCYPQASAALRGFTADCGPEQHAASETGRIVELEERRNRNQSGIRRELQERKPLYHVMKKRGSVATFIVRVQHREHSSWQGEIVWVDRQQKRSFRSVLELIRLMSSALSP